MIRTPEEFVVETVSRARGRIWGGRIAALFVPLAYSRSPELRSRLSRIFGFAVAIRLVLMPFATHSDLISTYHRSFRLLADFKPGRWVPHELVQAAALKLWGFVLPLEELLVWDGGGATASVEFWLESFVRHPKVFVALFLFKLPYLVFDVAVGLLFLRLFAESPAKGVRAARLWLFNPITIFTFYVFGRHDVVGIFFVVLALLWLEQSSPVRAAVAMGVAIWSRYYPLLFLPFLGILHRSGRATKAKMLVASLAPIAVYNLVAVLTSGSKKPPIIWFANSRIAEFPLGAKLEIGWIQEIYLYPVLLGVLILLAATLDDRESFLLRFSAWCCAALSLYYATSLFHPQYFTWFIPFLVVLRSDGNNPVLSRLHYLQILLFIFYTFYFGRPLFGYLLAPLNPEFFTSLASPAEVIGFWLPDKMILGVIRSGLSATCVFLAGWVLCTQYRHLWPRPPGSGEEPEIT